MKMSDAIVRSVSTAPATRQQVAPLEFTAEQRKMILNSFLSGATESEAAVLLELARVRRLNPITKQIHFVKRWDSEKGCEVWASQVAIDGFRAIADRTGLYGGQDEPEFEYDAKGQLKLCRVRIYRKDWDRPAVGVAYFTEFAQYKKDRSLTRMWQTKPHVMLAKCAEVQGHRKAFPEDVSGLEVPEEFGDPEEKEINPPPPLVNVDPALPKTKALAAQVAARLQPAAQPPAAEQPTQSTKSKMQVIDVPPEPQVSPPAPLPIDAFGTGIPLEKRTDEQLTAYKKFLMGGKWKGEKAKDAQAKLELVLKEEERRQPQLPLGDEPPPPADEDQIPFGGAQ